MSLAFSLMETSVSSGLSQTPCSGLFYWLPDHGSAAIATPSDLALCLLKHAPLGLCIYNCIIRAQHSATQILVEN